MCNDYFSTVLFFFSATHAGQRRARKSLSSALMTALMTARLHSLQPQVVEMLSDESDHVLLALSQTLLLFALRRWSAVGAELGAQSVVIVAADSVGIVADCRDSVGVRCPCCSSRGRLAILRSVAAGQLGVPVMSCPVGLHVSVRWLL